MSTHRNLIVSLICTSAIYSAHLQAQQEASNRSLQARTIVDSYPNRTNETTSAQTSTGAKVVQKYDERQAKKKKAQEEEEEQAAADQNRQSNEKNRVIPGQDRNRDGTNNRRVMPEQKESRAVTNNGQVMPGQDRNRAAQENKQKVRSRENKGSMTNNGHVVPGQDSNRAAHVTPGQDSDRSTRTNRNGVKAPVVVENKRTHVIPGSRQLTHRPVVVRRELPQTIIIDRRCAPCPYLALTPFAISKKGDLIELDDGSLWEVRSRDQKIVKRWAPGDIILIETGSYFFWSTYRLVNYTVGESVDVQLSLAHGWTGRASHWIVEVNLNQGYIRLEDGSLWRMSARELARWQVNDDIIIGLTKNWFSDDYSYMLVNPRVQNRITAVFEF